MLSEEAEPLTDESHGSQSFSITAISIMLTDGAKQTQDLSKPVKPVKTHTHASTNTETNRLKKFT